MKLSTPVLFGMFFISSVVNAQEKSIEYYSHEGKPVDKASSEYYEVGIKKNGILVDSVFTYFTASNKLRSIETRSDKGYRQNYYHQYYENGNLKDRHFYKDGTLSDSSSSFYENGRPLAVYFHLERTDFTDMREPKLIQYWDSLGVQVVKNGEGKCGCNYTWGPFEYYEEGIIRDGYRDGNWKGFQNDTLRYEEVYNIGVLREGIQHYNGRRIKYTKNQEMAEYPGGLPALSRFVGQNLKYPKSARRLGFEGRAYISFVVRKTGELDSFDVVNANSIHSSLADEALRVVKDMPKWKPGTLKGLPVSSRFVLPISFKLEN
jgi:TonB family protein